MYLPSFSYSQLLQQWPRQAEEKKETYPLFSERHLQAMWLEQKYFRNLSTSAGEPIEVISPGAWNGEAGPDFRHAHLRIGGQEAKGDIELHLSQEGWVHHKHHLDQRYDQVVLHICLWQPRKEHPIHASSGRELIQVYLEPYLTISPARITRLLDLDLYPYRKFLGSGKCAQSLFRHMPEESIQSLFSSAAEWRFREKCNHLTEQVVERRHRLPLGMAAAMGYKQHSKLFMQLFHWLHSQPAHPIEERIGLLLGVCGFFQQPFLDRWGHSKIYLAYLAQWKRMVHPDLPSFPVKVQATRPYNHPIRRLIALAFLTQDQSLTDLLPQLVAIWKSCWRECATPREFRQLSNSLIALFPIYHHLYWNSHFLFEDQPAKQFLTLMGKDFFSQVLVNTVVPLLQESLSSPEEEQALLEFVAALTLPISGKHRYLVHRFFGDSPRGEALRSGLMEQGAFQLHRDFCVHYESSCEGCPFVERVKNHATFSFQER